MTLRNSRSQRVSPPLRNTVEGRLKRAMKKRNEDGNLFLWYVVAFGLMMGIFGLSVDFGFSTYARNSLQNSLDSAAVAGAAEVQTIGSGGIIIHEQRALATIEELYDKNRSNVPDAVCSRQINYDGMNRLRSGERRGGTDSCWIISDYDVDNRNGTLTVSVREYKPTYFIKMIGIPYQEIQLTATARLTADLEQG